jgi:hypothetical protein
MLKFSYVTRWMALSGHWLWCMGQHNLLTKKNFLTELMRMCSHENLPLIVGGDYNILRHPSEKNNSNYNAR